MYFGVRHHALRGAPEPIPGAFLLIDPLKITQVSLTVAHTDGEIVR